MWIAAALTITVLVGGVIAYAGDLIGRRLGKRRVSVFGLRPKHTAILITSVTGVVISCITTVVLFLMVPPVREVLLQGRAALKQLPGLRKQTEQLRKEIADERSRLATALTERQSVQLDLDRARRDYRRIVAELGRTRARLVNAQTLVRRAEAARAAAFLAAGKAQTQAKQARAQTRLEQQQAQKLAELNEGLRGVNMELAKEKAALTASVAKLNQQIGDLQQHNAELQRRNDEAARQNADLQAETTRLNTVISGLRERQAALSVAVAELETRNADLERTAVDIFGRNRTLWGLYESLRTGRVAVQGGEDLARTVLPSGSTPRDVREGIDQLLHAAHLSALAKGAGPGAKARAVQIVDKRLFVGGPNGPGYTVQVTEEDRISALVARLTQSPEPMCLVALAVANSVAGEPAAIDLQPFSNGLIYVKGQAIISRTVNGREPATAVFTALVGFLKSVGQSALGRGLIPRFDPSTGEPQVGAMGAADLVGLTERVRRIGKSVTLTAAAGADTRAAEPLQLTFRVEPRP
jgi:uncharacterized protein (DUF3084 family)